jgi:hypothetical protein
MPRAEGRGSLAQVLLRIALDVEFRNTVRLAFSSRIRCSNFSISPGLMGKSLTDEHGRLHSKRND